MASETVIRVAEANHALLPCPFCGTSAELNTASNNRDWMIISCPNLTCAVLPRIEGQYAELQETIAAWNKRESPTGPSTSNTLLERASLAGAGRHLTDAAPDLLAALKRRNAMDRGNADFHEAGCRCVVHEADAAIAKAEGRS